MRTPDPIRDGLCLALVTKLGRFGWRPSIADHHEARGYASWVVPFGDGAVLVARGYAYPRGSEYGGELAQLAPPSALDGEADALDYARRLADHLEHRGWDMAVSVALLRPTARGLAGWVCGGVEVWRVDGEVRPCAPSQVLEQKPGGSFMPGIVLSGVGAGQVVGGHWFDVAGASFALCIGMPPPAIDDDELAEVAAHQPVHAVERLGLHVAETCHHPSGIVGVWHVGGVESGQGGMDWLESGKRLWNLGIATSWAQLTDPLRGRAAVYLEGMWELEELLDGDESPQAIAGAMLHHGAWLCGALSLAGPEACRQVIDAHAGYYDAAVAMARAALPEDPAVRNVKAYGAALRAVGEPAETTMNAGEEVRAWGDGDVPAAWRAFVESFPAALAAGSLDWANLVAAASFVHSDIDGNDAGDVGAWLHGQIVELAAAERGPNGPRLRMIEARAGGQTGQAGFAKLVVEFRTSARPGLSVACRLTDMPAHLRDATYRGMRAAIGAHASGATGLRAVIVGALIHPVDATSAAFERAGAVAIRRYFEGGELPRR